MNPYFTFNTYLRQQFGEKVWKIPVDAGFSCPNILGEKGTGGCSYCRNDSFVHVEPGEIRDQVLQRILRLEKKNIQKFIVYFQSYSNTYGALSEIQEKIESALVDDRIVGIHVGTRPDVIDEEKLAYFAKLAKRYDLFLELGLQSSHNRTLQRINRGHTLEDFDAGLKLAHSFGIKVCAHVILGLPGEGRTDMLETVDYLAKCGVESVKFHHLHVLKDTQMGLEFANGEIDLLTEVEYIAILAESIAHLPNNTVIARLVGDAPDQMMLAPDWPRIKSQFLNKFNQYLKNHNLYQGKFFKK